VLETAVIGVPSIYTEEEVKAVVVLRHNAKCSALDLVTWATGRLPRYALPRYVEFMNELPTTETSKVRKQALRVAWSNAQTFDIEGGQFLLD
jgi:crotonobetaine/carnitine-CoA ligase